MGENIESFPIVTMLWSIRSWLWQHFPGPGYVSKKRITSLSSSLKPCIYVRSLPSWSPPSAYGKRKLRQTIPLTTRLTTGAANGQGRPSLPTSPTDSNYHRMIPRKGSSSNLSCFVYLFRPSMLRNPKCRFRRFGETVRPGVLLIPSLQIQSYLIHKSLDEFRVALLSYATPTRLYSSSKSRWQDFNKALGLLMEVCVRQGSGGAYLVPRKLP